MNLISAESVKKKTEQEQAAEKGVRFEMAKLAIQYCDGWNRQPGRDPLGVSDIARVAESIKDYIENGVKEPEKEVKLPSDNRMEVAQD